MFCPSDEHVVKMRAEKMRTVHLLTVTQQHGNMNWQRANAKGGGYETVGSL